LVTTTSAMYASVASMNFTTRQPQHHITFVSNLHIAAMHGDQVKIPWLYNRLVAISC